MIAFPEPTAEITLSDIEAATRAFADTRSKLVALVDEINAEIEAIKRKRIERIKKLVGDAAEKHNALKNKVEAAKHLFVRPRTVVFHGVKVGLQKGKGGLVIEDEERTLQLIKKHFKDQVDTLIRTTEHPDKEHIEDLDAADLKKIGVQIGATGDFVVIKPTDSAVDKVVKALLKEATEEVAA